MTPQQFEEMLIRHESFENRMYTCPAGHKTIGVGHNLDENPISDAAVIQIMRDDIAIHAEELEQAFPVVKALNQVRYYVLLDMAFNMGIPALKGFKKMWQAIELGYWHTAAKEMLDSKWSVQVGKRATDLSRMMLTGEYLS